VNSEAELLALEGSYLAQGYEGLIIRDPNSLYKEGRVGKGGEVVRLKRFEDREAVILEMVECEENQNTPVRDELGRMVRSSHQSGKVGKGILGAMRCLDEVTGKEIRVGCGVMSHEERREHWEVGIEGKRIKYKCFPCGEKDKPRFPTFLSFRPEGY
jgi:DNA ligase-1